MKQTIRLLSFFLCLILLAGAAVSCSSGDKTQEVPDGMMIATCTGADYRFFSPTGWNLNTYYGVSGVYYNLSVQSTVSVNKYAQDADLLSRMTGELTDPDDRAARAVWFYENELLPPFRSLAVGDSFQAITDAPTVTLLDTVNAYSFQCKETANGTSLVMLSVVGEKNDAFYVITFTCDESIYPNLLGDVTRMLEEFYFTDVPYLPDEMAKPVEADAEAPEGMKLASNDEVAYRFYIPVDWKFSSEERIFSAYTDDRSNVSIVPYLPDEESLSVAQYFTMCRDQMIAVGGEESFELLSETECTMGGRTGTSYVFNYRVGKTVYRYRQVVVAYKSMIYSMTYTALPENFDAHLSDVDRIIAAFVFR